MVSLRQRTARASYSNVADGLADLSDEGDGGDSGNASASGSKQGLGANDAGEDEDGSGLSSGESSEFRPDSPEKRDKGKRKAGQEDPLDEDDNEDEDDELIDEVVDSDSDQDVVPVLRSISETPDLVSVQTAGSTGHPRKKPSGAHHRLPPLPRLQNSAAPPAHGQSEITTIDFKYRTLIQASAASMAKPSVASRQNVTGNTERERDQPQGLEALPDGHPTPYSTRLTQDPQRGWVRAETEWLDESGPSSQRKATRREHIASFQKDTTIGLPYEEWRGEGWWPEMYVGSQGGSSGSREQWIAKDDVRLGLDEVGRWTKEELTILSDGDADAYLPTPFNRQGEPHISCYLGPHYAQTKVDFSLFDSMSIASTNPNVPREGHTFFAGGPIWGMDWAPCPESKWNDFKPTQYLAVSTLPHIDTRPALGEKWPRTSKGCIQLWAMSAPHRGSDTQGDQDMEDGDSGGMRCDVVLCVHGGPVMELKWIPLGVWDDYDALSVNNPGIRIPKLGILAAVQLDGSVSFYAVPHPQFMAPHDEHPLYLQMDQPLLRLEVSDTSAMCLDWLTASRVAVGLANGHIAVWDIYDAIKEGSSEGLLPSLYVPAAVSAIRSIAAGRVPPASDQLDGDPIYLVVGAYDGSTVVMDLRDPMFPIEINDARVPSMAVGWLAQLSSPVMCDIDYVISTIRLRRTKGGASHALSSHKGQAWDIASSDYHTMLLSAGADGVLMLCDFNVGFFRKKKAPMIMQRLYEMDYNETTDEYKMVDDILPEAQTMDEAASRRTTIVAKRGIAEPPSHMLNVAAWSPHVGIHKVVWNTGGGLGRAGWAASGSASGLGRVEWIEGRWSGGRA
ncbi:hypothetical protein IAU60_004834 [Kwoniella sp. DSM 27419]